MIHRIIAVIGLISVLAPGLRAQQLKLEPNQRYLLLAAGRTSTTQSELEEASALGFRALVATGRGAELVIFLERVAQPPDTYRYQLLATTRTSTMEKELNTMAAEGFRLLSRTLSTKQSLGAGGALRGGLLGGRDSGSEIVAVMERPPKVDTRYEYRLLATSRTSTLQKEVAEATAQGFMLIGLVSRDENLVLMEKELPVQR